MSDLSRFSATLKGFRAERRLSQSKLAEHADFDHSYVSRLESGARQPSREAVMYLALALDLTPAEEAMLLTSAGFTAGDVVDADLEPIAVLLRCGPMAANPDKRKRAIALIQGIASLIAKDLLMHDDAGNLVARP